MASRESQLPMLAEPVIKHCSVINSTGDRFNITIATSSLVFDRWCYLTSSTYKEIYPNLTPIEQKKLLDDNVFNILDHKEEEKKAIENKESKENKDSKDVKETKEIKENKDQKDHTQLVEPITDERKLTLKNYKVILEYIKLDVDVGTYHWTFTFDHKSIARLQPYYLDSKTYNIKDTLKMNNFTEYNICSFYELCMSFLARHSRYCILCYDIILTPTEHNHQP